MNVQATAEIPISVRRWKSYPAYKESGVEWVPKIPSHWEMQRLKFVLLQRLQYGANEEAGETDLASPRFVRITDINARGELRDDTFRSLAEEKAKPYLLEEGDILLARSGATVGKSFQYRNSWGRCCFAGYLIRGRLDQTKCLPDFLNYFTSSTNYWDWIASSLIQATIQNVSAEKYGSLSLPLPSTPEQQTIISFLDRETAKINALMAKKERLIALLQEKRAALITHAVTKGLDPNVPMKDSGIEWLGLIPPRWKVRKVKEVSKLQTGLTLGKKYEGERLTLRPYLRVANVQDGYLDLEEITEVEVPASDVWRHELQHGDVLMTEGGDFDKLGRGYMWEGQIPGCLHQNHIFAVRPTKGLLDSHFITLVMNSHYGRAYFTATSKQSTNLASTNSTKLRNFSIPFPDLLEQEEIVNWVRLQVGRIDSLIAKVREGIEKLKEYRTALISAAVTGKIDVRGKTSL